MNLDKVGMTASSICGVHCILTPVLLVLFPYASIAFIHGEFFEWGFILFSLILASFALFQGFLVHKKFIPFILAFTGFFTFIVVKLLSGSKHESFSSAIIFVIAGSLICFSHYINHKHCKHSKCCEHVES